MAEIKRKGNYHHNGRVIHGLYADNKTLFGMWQTMKDRGVTTYTLIYKKGISAYTVTNLKRNKSITMNTMEKLCDILHCTPNDIVEFVEE